MNIAVDYLHEAVWVDDCLMYPTLGIARTLYERKYGALPKGLNVCHTCDNPWCINEVHLWIGTQSENIVDALRKGRLPQAAGPKSEATRAKLSAGKKGVPIAQAHKDAMRAGWAKRRLKNIPDPRVGVPLSETHRAALRVAQQRVHATESYRANIKAAYAKPEVRKLMSEATKAAMQRPEVRAKLLAAVAA